MIIRLLNGPTGHKAAAQTMAKRCKEMEVGAVSQMQFRNILKSKVSIWMSMQMLTSIC